MTTLAVRIAVTLAIAAAAPALAAGPIDGTWKSDLASTKPSAQPDVYLLKGGTYSCTSCTPPYAVPADGKFHAVKGRPYWDEVSITVVDANRVAMSVKQKGQPVGTGADTVSADGKTLTSSFTQTATANGVPITGTSVATRVGARPAGAHAVSGSWRQTATTDLSDSGAVFTFADSGDALSLSLPTGESYTAKYGAAPTSLVGDKADTMVTVKKAGPRTYVESGTRAGKPVYEMTFTVAADGKSMLVTTTNKRNGKTSSYTALKQ